MSRNGKRQPARPHIEVNPGSASPEEAAAIAAAIERFRRDSVPPLKSPSSVSPWLKAGIHEAAGAEPWEGLPWT